MYQVVTCCCVPTGGRHHSQECAACDRLRHWCPVRLPGDAAAGGGQQPLRGGGHVLLLSLHVWPAGEAPLPLRLLPGFVHQRCRHAGSGMGLKT